LKYGAIVCSFTSVFCLSYITISSSFSSYYDQIDRTENISPLYQMFLKYFYNNAPSPDASSQDFFSWCEPCMNQFLTNQEDSVSNCAGVPQKICSSLQYSFNGDIGFPQCQYLFSTIKKNLITLAGTNSTEPLSASNPAL
jgi:hypothetical protein